MKHLNALASLAISCHFYTLASAWTSQLLHRLLPIHAHANSFKTPRHQPKFHPLFSTLSESDAPYTNLSSAYDKALPPALVGEAIRSALRSDRGICWDFTTNRFSDNGSEGRLVSVVHISGKGTRSFLNAKFSQSVPKQNSVDVAAGSGSTKLQLLRSGVAFETGYLTAKGRIIDRILVLAFLKDKSEDASDEAFLVTSPGNSGSKLFDELAPFVFPMDQVKVTDCSSNSAQKYSIVTLACSKLKNAQISFQKNTLRLLLGDESSKFDFPPKTVCHHYRSGDTDLYMLEHTFLPIEACHGYTLLFCGDGSLSNAVWEKLTNEYNNEGPVGVGSLEYETLRIEAGLPGYGYEMTGDGPKKKKLPDDADTQEMGDKEQEKYYSKANPLELHLQYLVDTEKGCYQGQEGVASILKNKRGSPRTLYQVVFYDKENQFDDNYTDNSFLVSIDTKKIQEFQQLKKQSTFSNKTRQPRPGDILYVLGSNESIQVGTVTSVAEPNGTGEATTFAMALVRRSQSVLDSIKEQDLEMPRWWESVDDDDDDEVDEGNVGLFRANIARDEGTSGLMNPPPLDPLHNLEVTVGGTYTIGRLRSVPSRTYEYSNNGDVASLLDYERRGKVVEVSPNAGAIEPDIKRIEDKVQILEDEDGVTIDIKVDNEDQISNDLAEAAKEAAEAAAQAEAAAADAKRKAEKMEMLKAKAEAALAARRNKKK